MPYEPNVQDMHRIHMKDVVSVQEEWDSVNVARAALFDQRLSVLGRLTYAVRSS